MKAGEMMVPLLPVEVGVMEVVMAVVMVVPLSFSSTRSHPLQHITTRCILLLLFSFLILFKKLIISFNDFLLFLLLLFNFNLFGALNGGLQTLGHLRPAETSVRLDDVLVERQQASKAFLLLT
ncbi:hypothetical protein TYRP_019905 [Tyrophagus putrescentiae]|nr:hypothetical protein TYRP_019905 [Tyrophagus putrescentiae]